MSKLIQDIKTGFGSATALYKLMAINTGVFLALQLLRLVFYLVYGSDVVLDLSREWLSLPASFLSMIYKPWTLITYMFLHLNLMHIFFNLLIFYWSGKLFTEYLGNERLWSTYILSGLTGGILYMLAYNLLPVFDGSEKLAYLMGASAGIIGVMVGIATLLPDYTVQLLFIGPVRLKYIALFSVILYAISIPEGNAGGNISHLGGALFGFIMVKQLRKGTDITAWLVKLFRKKGGKMKVVESKRKRTETDEEYYERKKSRQEIIDQILDKISQSGYSSLSTEEKDILFKASKNIKE